MNTTRIRRSETAGLLPHPLPVDSRAERWGLRRIVVSTGVGELVVRAGREAGGPATILLHGAAGSWTTWTPLIADADLHGTAMTDIIAIDLPGWGESTLDDERGAGVSVISGVVADVARELGYVDWHVIGHSLGGFIALDLAAREPQATLSVGLVSGTGVAVLDALRHPLAGGLRLPWFAGMLLAMRFLIAIGAYGRAFVRALQAHGLLAPLSSPLFADRQGLHPSVVAALAEEIRPRAFVHAARAASDYDVTAWRGIRCPVRSVRGGRDVFVGDHDAEAFAMLIPDFHEVRIPDAGHFAAIERPDIVLALLVDHQAEAMVERVWH